MTPAKLLLLFVIVPACSHGQRIFSVQKSSTDQSTHPFFVSNVFTTNAIASYNDSTYYFFHFTAGSCKLNFLSWDSLQFQKTPVVVTNVPSVAVSNPGKHSPFLEIHGNVTYDLFYRSDIDTPYADNVMQHTASTFFAAMSSTYTTVDVRSPS